MGAPLAIVIFSGGLDSATAVWWALSQGWRVITLAFDYGQRHSKELDAAYRVWQAGSPLFQKWEKHIVVDLSAAAMSTMRKGSQTTDAAVPHGHYTDKSMAVTVVPNRNMIFLALATGRAVMEDAQYVLFGAHAGDHAIYADCRPEFFGSMRQVVRLATQKEPVEVELQAPFIHKTKAAIVRLGFELHVPFLLTWSCYEGGDLHCGKCGTCVERREAFALAGLPDPTVYAP